MEVFSPIKFDKGGHTDDSSFFVANSALSAPSGFNNLGPTPDQREGHQLTEEYHRNISRISQKYFKNITQISHECCIPITEISLDYHRSVTPHMI